MMGRNNATGPRGLVIALRAYGVRVAPDTFFFSSTPTRIPETMAASVACSMAFMVPSLIEDPDRRCPSMSRPSVRDVL